jgi:hypothetical protein
VNALPADQERGPASFPRCRVNEGRATSATLIDSGSTIDALSFAGMITRVEIDRVIRSDIEIMIFPFVPEEVPAPEGAQIKLIEKI